MTRGGREEGELVNGMRGRKEQRGEVWKHRVVEVGLIIKRLQFFPSRFKCMYYFKVIGGKLKWFDVRVFETVRSENVLFRFWSRLFILFLWLFFDFIII